VTDERQSLQRPAWLGGQLHGSTSWRAGSRIAGGSPGGSVEAAGGRGPAVGRPPAAPSEPPAPRVLIVVDVRRVREAVRDLLELDGVEVVGEAANGRAAIALAQRHDPDVTLMDWRMPVLDGLEATREISRLGLRTRVVICTAFDGQAIRDQAMAAGAFGVVAKGEHPRKLIELVRRAWHARAAAP
jgi:CheY-like chemotaxis protein